MAIQLTFQLGQQKNHTPLPIRHQNRWQWLGTWIWRNPHILHASHPKRYRTVLHQLTTEVRNQSHPIPSLNIYSQEMIDVSIQKT